MEWNSCRTAIRVSVLAVRSALANLGEPEALQDRGDLTRFEDRYVPHLRDLDGLRADELTLQLGFTVLEKHRDDLFEILSQLVDARALRVRARPSWDIAHEQTRIRVPLDDRRERPHGLQGSARSDA